MSATISLPIIIVTVIAAAPFISAHPSYWAQIYVKKATGKCETHPSRGGYGPHSGILDDPTGAIYSLSIDGAEKTRVCPGQTYALKVKYNTKREVLLTATAGTLVPEKGSGFADCHNRVILNDVKNVIDFTYTAPCAIPEGGIKIESTTADFNDFRYKKSSATFLQDDGCAAIAASCSEAGRQADGEAKAPVDVEF